MEFVFTSLRRTALMGTALVVAAACGTGTRTPVPPTRAPTNTTASPSTSTSPPTTASELAWDERLAPLVAFVEGARGLEFERTVPVEVLDDLEFRRSLTVDDTEVTLDERTAAAEQVGVLRALGLVGTDVGLDESESTLTGEGVAAFYDDSAGRIVLREGTLGVDEEATLVHELTHALQDQHFDLDRDFDTGSEEFAFSALVEGDAQRIEEQYAGWYGPTAAAEPAASDAPGFESENPTVQEVPAVMRAYTDAPYSFGSVFVGALVRAGGNERVDGAFETPPTSELHVLDPSTYLDGGSPQQVDLPALHRGERALDDEQEFGPLAWLVVLGERLDPATAIEAALAWGGDTAIAYERDGITCLRVATTGVDSAATSVLQDAITSWADRMPSSAVTVARDGRVIVVDACARDDAVAATTGHGWDAYLVAVVRAFWLERLAVSGASNDVVECVSTKFARVADPEVFDFEAADADDIARLELALIEACPSSTNQPTRASA